jgi:hypothetical protein
MSGPTEFSMYLSLSELSLLCRQSRKNNEGVGHNGNLWHYSSCNSLRIAAMFLLLMASLSFAHEHVPVTHRFTTGKEPDGLKLILDIREHSTGRSSAARFSLEVDGLTHTPDWVGENGILFTSIHLRSNNRSTVQFSKGIGPVRLSLPKGAKTVTVSVAKGFEYLPTKTTVQVQGEETKVSIGLKRWVNLTDDGWIAIDEHLHFDRLDPEDDKLWFSMFEADGLAAGHFMVLKGGMTPGIWSRQFKYGKEGRGSDGNRILIPGQEYRDTQQGHINLLGLDEVILPYSTGGMGTPTVVENYPPLSEVLKLAQDRNGLAGVAHGGTLGQYSTSLADAVLGTVDFWEISNGFIYNTENWYRLMNCGIFLPIVAGTDLPNSPFRDPWQPMFGAVRTYVNSGGEIDFESFRTALQAGRSFISGGPLIDLEINETTIGETLRLPHGGGVVSVRATLQSPLPLHDLVVVQGGKDLDLEVSKSTDDGIHQWSIESDLKITQSSWVSVWGKGTRIEAQQIDAMAHAGVIKVIVGNEPIESSEDAGALIESFQERKTWYQENGKYETDIQRRNALTDWDKAILKLEKQLR